MTPWAGPRYRRLCTVTMSHEGVENDVETYNIEVLFFRARWSNLRLLGHLVPSDRDAEADFTTFW